MITSTVMFRLKRPITDEERGTFVSALKNLAADPPYANGPALVVESLALRGEESPGSADVVMQMEFSDADAFDKYTYAESHQAFSAEFEPQIDKVLAAQHHSAPTR